MSEKREIVVDGIVYVRKDAVELKEDCSIVRTDSAGVFAGHLVERSGGEGRIVNSRRLWRWEGAVTLDQLAMEGVKKPDDCKFPCVVPNRELIGIIEVIPCTSRARDSIEGVPVWEV